MSEMIRFEPVLSAFDKNRIFQEEKRALRLFTYTIYSQRPYCSPGSFDCDLLQLLAEHSAIVDGSDETGQVHQAGETMDTSKALVQGSHLFRVRCRVIALLAIPGFYKG